jgi:hypothetical protein
VRCGYVIFHLYCVLAEVLVLYPDFSYHDMYGNGEIVCSVYFEYIMNSYFLPKQNFTEVLFFTKVFKINCTLIMYLFIYYIIPQLSPFFDMVMLLVSVVGFHICYTIFVNKQFPLSGTGIVLIMWCHTFVQSTFHTVTTH